MDTPSTMPLSRVALQTSHGLVALLVLTGELLSGCSSTASTSRPAPASTTASGSSWSASETETRLRAAAERWNGTPHEWGGASQRGVDCSGLVQSVFANQFDVRVPRTTKKQARAGRSVSADHLQPGDLVFFRTGDKKRHVGIYLADGRFLHASASSGVTLSPLSRSYWQKHWWQGRRLLSLNGETPPAAPDRPAPDNQAPATAW